MKSPEIVKGRNYRKDNSVELMELEFKGASLRAKSANFVRIKFWASRCILPSAGLLEGPRYPGEEGNKRQRIRCSLLLLAESHGQSYNVSLGTLFSLFTRFSCEKIPEKRKKTLKSKQTCANLFTKKCVKCKWKDIWKWKQLFFP